MKRRKQQEEEAWERDPRWNGDTFKYMPKVPEDLLSDKKYSRLAACSRTSSMRSENAPKPPNYSDLFDGTAAVNIPSSSPPSYTSKTPSVELSSSNETVNKDNNKVLQVTDQVVTVKKERVRIAGVDTPEKRTKNLEEKALGIDATNWLKEKLEGTLAGDDELSVRTELVGGTGKYGRLLGWLYIGDDTVSLNEQMIEFGYALAYDGGTKDMDLEKLREIRRKHGTLVE
jgi:micrococcal nuclease